MGNVGPNMMAARIGQGKNIERLDVAGAAKWFATAGSGSVLTSFTDNAGYGPFGGSSTRILGTNSAAGLLSAVLLIADRARCAAGESVELEFIASIVSMVNGTPTISFFGYDSAGVFTESSTPLTIVNGVLQRLVWSPTLDTTVYVSPTVRVDGTGGGAVDVSFDCMLGVVK